MRAPETKPVGPAPLHPAELCWLSPAIEAEDGEEAGQGMAHAFRVGARWFLIPMDLPAEVAPVTSGAKLPFTAPWCLGLVNFRGALVAAYDLSRVFGEAPSGRLFLVLGQRDARAALLIDEITVITLPLDARTAPSTPLPNLPGELPGQALELDGKVYIQLDLSGLLRLLAQRATLL